MPSIAGMFSSIGPTRPGKRLGAKLDRALEGLRRILHPKRHRADRRTVLARERLRKAVGLGIDDEVDVALPMQRHVLAAMAGDDRESQLFEQRAQQLGIGGRVFDELESVGAHRIVEEIGPGCGIGHGGVRVQLVTLATIIDVRVRHGKP